jgi:hypothetical protein
MHIHSFRFFTRAVFFLLLLSPGIMAQEKPVGQEAGRWNWSVARYRYGLLNPGVNASLEYPLLAATDTTGNFLWLNSLGWSPDTLVWDIEKEFLVQWNSAVYHHPQNHLGLHLNMQFVGRLGMKPPGLFFELGTGIGYLHNFYTTTYETTGTGEYKEPFLPGRGFATWNFSAGFGVDLGKLRKDVPIAIYWKPNVFFIFPYNHLFNLNTAQEVGVRFNLKK